MDWLADDQTSAGIGLSLARMTVRPGKTSPAHRHPNCNEVIHVLAGQIDQRRGDDWETFNTGETCLVKAGQIHQSRCKSTIPAMMIIAYSDGTRIYEEVNI